MTPFLTCLRVPLLLGLSLTCTGCLSSYCASHLEDSACVGLRSGVDAGAGANRDPSTLASCNGLTETAAPVEPARAPPAITGGSLVALADGSWVVADADRSTVWHVGHEAVLGAYPLRVGDGPGRVLAVGNRAFIVLRGAGQLAEFDPEHRALVRWPTCTEPRALALRDDKLLVGCATGRIEEVPLSALDQRTVLVESPALADLRDFSFDGDRLLVSTFRNAQVLQVQANAQPSLLRAAPLAPDGAKRTFVPRVAWRMQGAFLLAQDVLSSSLPPSSACSEYYGPLPSFVTGVVTTSLYRVGADVFPVAQVPKAVVAVDLAEHDGVLFVASAGTNSLIRIESHTQVQSSIDLPGQPTSVAFSGETLAVFLREPASLLTFSSRGERLTSVSFNAESVFSAGHDLFHRATPKGIACASCHPEAGEDGHVWQFAEGPRRTPSLRGGLAQSAPFHWSGDQADMSQLMQNVMNARMGGASQTQERSAALLAWLDVQPALNAPPVDDEAAQRGRLLFESPEAGCAACHTGPLGTNNATVDVGTGGQFQVPRLRELAWRAPLFHDGSVADLGARLEPIAGAQVHGKVSHLDATARADLLEYLKAR